MKEVIIVIMVVVLYAVVAGWYGKADAQVVTITDGEGTTTEVFCWEEEGYVFCE